MGTGTSAKLLTKHKFVSILLVKGLDPLLGCWLIAARLELLPLRGRLPWLSRPAMIVGDLIPHEFGNFAVCICLLATKCESRK